MSAKKRNPKGSTRAVSKARGSALPENKKTGGRESSGLVDRQAGEDNQLLMSIRQIIRSRSGPLPPPEDLEKYGKILPDAPERIMTMAEEEQRIRKDNQTRTHINNAKRMNRAALIGAGLTCVLGLATWRGSVPLAAISIFLVALSMSYGLLQRKSARDSR